MWDLLRRLTYRRAARVVAQTLVALGYFSRAVQCRASVIPNPLATSRSVSGAAGHEPAEIIMGMGRLADQKGFDLLARAFSIVAWKHRAWSLVIWGAGPLREELESLRSELGLDSRISFPGWTADPFRGNGSSPPVRAVIALRGLSQCALRGDGVRPSGSEFRLYERSTGDHPQRRGWYSRTHRKMLRRWLKRWIVCYQATSQIGTASVSALPKSSPVSTPGR